MPDTNKSIVRRNVLILAFVSMLSTFVIFSLSGCAAFFSDVNEIKGKLVGNSFTIETYNNYGQLTMTTTGKKISMESNYVQDNSKKSSDSDDLTYVQSSVVTITIDGKEIETCGDTCIFMETGLEPTVDFTNPDMIESDNSGSLLENTSISYVLNKYRNAFGKPRIVVVKSQMGVPICAFSGKEVYYEVCDDLPKTTKLMIDGKALYIHRANFQIIDSDLIQ